MPLFKYKAKTSKGEMIGGTMDADSRAMVISRLQTMSYFPVSVMAEADAAKAGGLKGLFGSRITSNDICNFYRQMADLIAAGIALVKALQIVLSQTPSESLRAAVSAVTADVQGGATFATALEKHPKIFPSLATALINSGEKGGFLPDVLQQLAGFAELEEELKGKVRSALAYPVVMVFVGISAITFLMTFVMPKVTGMYEELGQTLPAPTQALIFISHGMVRYWYLIFGAIAALVAAVWRFSNTKEGQRLLHRAQLKAPLFGDLVLKRELSRFTRTLGQLLRNGVPILSALEIVSGVATNVIFREVIDQTPPDIAQGDSMSASLKKHGLFPAGVINMISTGEETGRLPEVLLRIAPSYEAQVDRSLKSLTSLIEPFIILGMGMVVGFVVIAMLLPILTIDPMQGMR